MLFTLPAFRRSPSAETNKHLDDLASIQRMIDEASPATLFSPSSHSILPLSVVPGLVVPRSLLAAAFYPARFSCLRSELAAHRVVSRCSRLCREGGKQIERERSGGRRRGNKSEGEGSSRDGRGKQKGGGCT